MPIYEYECQNCGHHVEVVQKMNDPALTKCEACGEDQLKKLMSLSSFALKGTGWYTTDYKSSPKKTSETTEKETEAKTDKKTSENKNSKPAKSDKPQKKTATSSSNSNT